MNLYSTLVSLHVVSAIFGLGPFVLFVLLGALHGVASRQLRRAHRKTLQLPRSLNPTLRTMCGLVVAITYLMEAKPC